MASLVESGMKNLNYGDADSVGFFQMRVGIWNQGAYAGYPEKPELQVKWFLDQAEAVKKQRLGAGKSVDDPNQFGEWIADVERPAEQYRGRYQTKLEEADGLLGSAPRARRVAARGPGAPPRRRRVGGASSRRDRGPCRPRSRRATRRPEGARRDRGGLEVHRHRLQVGRLDAADRLRLLRPDAVVLRAVRHRDPARDLHADRGAERHRGRGPRRPQARRPRVLRHASGDVHHVGMYLGDDKFLHAPQHRRRGQGLEPRRALLRRPVRGRAALRRRRRAGRPAPVQPVAAAPVPRRRAARRSTRPRSPRRRPPWRATPPRSAATTRSSSWRSRAPRRARHAKAERHSSAMFLKAVDPSQVEAPRARGGGRRATPRRRRSRPRRSPPPRRPSAAAARARGRRPSRPPRSTSRTPPPTTRATTPPRRSSPSGSPSRPRRPACRPSCPVMAALVESGVKNLNFGDADSVGFFQMRLGIWNQGAYAGYPREARAAGEVVHRPRARGQAQGDRQRRRRLRQGPRAVGRVDRRHRAARRAVPRPLPAAARRGAQAARVGLQPRAAQLQAVRSVRPARCHAPIILIGSGSMPTDVEELPVGIAGQRRRRRARTPRGSAPRRRGRRAARGSCSSARRRGRPAPTTSRPSRRRRRPRRRTRARCRGGSRGAGSTPR